MDKYYKIHFEDDGFASMCLESHECWRDHEFSDGTYGFSREYSLEEQDKLIVDVFLDYLQKVYVYDQDSQFCKNKVPEEGIVVRVERGDGIENFKLKSMRHYLGETALLDSGEVDIESEQSEGE